MVSALAIRKYVVPTLPERYNMTMQHVLRKGSEGARLRDKSANYFEIGLRISWLMDNTDLAAAIFNGVLKRLRYIVDRFSFSQRDESSESEFLHLLTNFEQDIYLSGVGSNEDFDKWRHGLLNEIRPLLPSALLVSQSGG
jgi:hypothetical protein